MVKISIITLLLLSLSFTHAFSGEGIKEKEQPNVILILTDDQGIGDLSCHGNPWLKTPNIDAFHKDAVRLTNFHVSPLCTPTRGALITGKYPINNGAWATFKGRDSLSEGTQTLAELFKQNGYTTGLFGKWHLGDNYPVRPTDCGFDKAVHHLAGGVGELSDYWGNSYFDDVYYDNNEAKEFKGYCTDVWFDEAMNFIEKNKHKPFFVYLPTNAPHDPWIVDDKYAEPYKELEGSKLNSADFYGMIANIDENFGRLTRFLKSHQLEDNTIVIFMTDNGSSGGISRDGKNIGYNMGFRGMKGSKTEGGHRVPFFMQWKNGHLVKGQDVDVLSAHIDVMPTLAALCELNTDDCTSLDGIDLSAYLKGEASQELDRSVFVHHNQNWSPPHDVKQSCIMSGEWRFINGNELYNISEDRYQTNNIAKDHPELISKLLDENAVFVKASKQNREYYELPVHTVGNKAQAEVKLTIQHAIGSDRGIWKCQQVAAGMKNTNNTHAIKVERKGKYEIRCCRWPKECPGAIWGIPQYNPLNQFEYARIKPQKARISIANQILEKDIEGSEEAVVFNIELDMGKTLLVNDFIEGDNTYGVYYTYIKYLGEYL